MNIYKLLASTPSEEDRPSRLTTDLGRVFLEPKERYGFCVTYEQKRLPEGNCLTQIQTWLTTDNPAASQIILSTDSTLSLPFNYSRKKFEHKQAVLIDHVAHLLLSCQYTSKGYVPRRTPQFDNGCTPVSVTSLENLFKKPELVVGLCADPDYTTDPNNLTYSFHYYSPSDCLVDCLNGSRYPKIEPITKRAL